MKISNAKVFVGGPNKNYVTLKVETDEGIYGIGDATLNNQETLPAAYLQDYFIPCLIGIDPRNSEDLWQYLMLWCPWRFLLIGSGCGSADGWFVVLIIVESRKFISRC